jgi:hypothetical protein
MDTNEGEDGGWRIEDGEENPRGLAAAPEPGLTVPLPLMKVLGSLNAAPRFGV